MCVKIQKLGIVLIQIIGRSNFGFFILIHYAVCKLVKLIRSTEISMSGAPSFSHGLLTVPQLIYSFYTFFEILPFNGWKFCEQPGFDSALILLFFFC